MILLQEVMPAASWVSIGLTAILAIMGTLIMVAYNNLKEGIKANDEALKHHAEQDRLKHAEIDKQLNETSLQILVEINAVRVKLAEFKADNNGK